MAREDPDRTAQIRARHADTIQEVVVAYLPQILRAARGAGLNPERAEDVAQATFLTFLQKAEQFDGRATVRTYLFGILYKKILESHRNTKRDHMMDDIEDVMEQRFDERGHWSHPPQPVDAGIAQAEIRRQIADCLEGLPDPQRIAFTLREVEQFTTSEICKILEISANNLGVILYRGRNRMRECLEEKGTRGSRDAVV